ncbi:MAG: PAS domain-containing protein [Chloroflexota bacterium]
MGLGEGLAGLARLLVDRHVVGERVRSACAHARAVLGADGCAVFFTPEGGSATILAADGEPGLPAFDGHPAAPPPPWTFTFPLAPAAAVLVVSFAAAPVDTDELHLRGEALASLLALALTEDGAASALRQREAEGQLLREVGRAIDACPDPMDALSAALARVREVTSLWLCVLESDDQGGPLELVARGSDELAGDVIGAALAHDQAATAPYIVALRTPSDVEARGVDASTALGKVLVAAGLERGLVMPLRAGMHGIGVLCAAGQTRQLVAWQGTLALLAERLAWALERARLFRLVERAKREWEATLDTIAEGVAILDSDLTILRANWAFARLMGTTPRDIVGQKGESLVYGDVLRRRDAPADLYGREVEGANHDVQMGDRHLLVTVYPFPNERRGRVGFVHVLREVTEERRWQ